MNYDIIKNYNHRNSFLTFLDVVIDMYIQREI
jgi:hypothetical protein